MINSLKIQGSGYLLNGISFVTKADGNIEYENIKKFLASGGVVEPEFTDTELLQQAKDKKLQTIYADYTTAENTPVPYNGIYFNGGDESATSIDKYVRLNRLAKNTTHSIWDVNNVEHSLTDTEADSLILAIGSQASVNKFTLKNRKVALANIALSTVTPVVTLANAILAVEAV